MGVLVPEALAAAQELEAEVIIITSADLLFRALRAARGLSDDDPWILDELFPSTRPLPIVSVLDGHPHALSFLSAIRGVPMTCLGTCEFGQSGQVDDLYRRYGIDVDGIIGAGIDLLDANA
jgi:pyruvate dehydrogenase E1 component